MKKIASDNYQDFVYSKGKLVAEFEEMYKESKDIPWHQDKQDEWLDIRLTVDLLRQYGPFDYICDFGCGLGYFLDLINQGVGAKESHLTGYDISETCCIKAKTIFPKVNFRPFDLASQDDVLTREEARGKRLYTTRGILLYFPNKDVLNTAIEHMASVMESQELLLVSQDFMPLSGSFVGKDILNGPEAVRAAFNQKFEPLKTIWLEDVERGGSNNWFIGLFKKR